jgi:hypothetical protein
MRKIKSRELPRLNSNATLSGVRLVTWLADARADPLPVIQAKKSWKARPVSKQTKARVGARPKWDWEDIELFVFAELEKKGDFHDHSVSTKGWQSYADLYKRIIEYVEKLAAGGGAGSGPSESTLKGRVPQMVAEWRSTNPDQSRPIPSNPD